MSAYVTTEWPVNRVRATFIDYFVEKRDHVFWPSCPVVPINDPTLLFINAGMNQFKPLFLGTCDPSMEMSKLKSAVNSQKCIRAGGKHNDLDDVGKDVYHHTFFEMLGNWSFGSYFKEEAIEWAWECLTVVFGIDPSRLYATYFGGDPSQGLQPDFESREIWLKFLPSNRIIACGCKENFWEMGATGPCGPCTEIHYDRIGDRDASDLVNADRPDVIEIWNNVFIQFNREADGSLRELPSKHVDTGMGLERLTSVLQNKDSNYDTDIFTPLFDAIHKVTGARPYTGLVGSDDTDLKDTAYRIVADHIRTLTFAITDGAVPSNDGRGYVLRRILRRAVRYGQDILGGSEGFFTTLVPLVVKNFSDAFPELLNKMDFVSRIIAEEESSFNRTLAQGVKYFQKLTLSLKNSGGVLITAKEAHILYSSMGFPLDLTELMAAECGLVVDKEGFNQLMENDRKISESAESARKGGTNKDLTMEAEQTAWLGCNEVVTTDSSSKFTWNNELTCKIVALYEGRGMDGPGFIDCVSGANDYIGVVLDATSFYFESGGQIYDTGVIITASDDKNQFIVTNVQTYAGYVVHIGYVISGEIKVNDSVLCRVDYTRRGVIAPNHTMTHALNHALKQTLISESSEAEKFNGLCEQKGSLVDSDKLRFDFSWSGPLSLEQLTSVESKVCKLINAGVPVYSQVVRLADAKRIVGLRQVFGEKYPDPVRVISIGVDINLLLSQPDNKEWEDFSIEFCGGTHLNNTIEAEDFVLIEEIGVAKGVRRISGLTKFEAKASRLRAYQLLETVSKLNRLPIGKELSNALKILKLEVDQACISLVDKEKLRSQISLLSDSLKSWYKSNLTDTITNANSIAEELAKQALSSKSPIIVQQINFGSDGKIARKIQEKIKSIVPETSQFIISFDEESDKYSIFALSVQIHLSKGLLANEWLDAVFKSIGVGKGGGKADQANGFVLASQIAVAELINAAEVYASLRLT